MADLGHESPHGCGQDLSLGSRSRELLGNGEWSDQVRFTFSFWEIGVYSTAEASLRLNFGNLSFFRVTLGHKINDGLF